MLVATLAFVPALSSCTNTNPQAGPADDALVAAYKAMQIQPLAVCNNLADKLGCFKTSAKADSQTVQGFQKTVSGIVFPSDVHKKVTTMKLAVQKFIDDFNAIAGAPNANVLGTIIASLDLDADGHAFDSSISKLSKQLDSER